MNAQLLGFAIDFFLIDHGGDPRYSLRTIIRVRLDFSERRIPPTPTPQKIELTLIIPLFDHHHTLGSGPNTDPSLP